MCRQPWEFAADDAADAPQGGSTSPLELPHSPAGRSSDASTFSGVQSSAGTQVGSARFSGQAMQLVLDSDEDEGEGIVVQTLNFSGGNMDSGSDWAQTEAEGGSVGSMSSSSVDLDLGEL